MAKSMSMNETLMFLVLKHFAPFQGTKAILINNLQLQVCFELLFFGFGV